MTKRNGKLILKPNPVDKVRYHDTEKIRTLGEIYKFLDNSMLEEAGLRIIVREIRKAGSTDVEYMKPHKHDVDQVYLILGKLRFKVRLGDKTHDVSSPATVFIPAGLLHSEKYLSGRGTLITILKKGTYP